MRKFDAYIEAEKYMLSEAVDDPDFISADTHESLGTGFILTNPTRHRNAHSNYNYAHALLYWMLSGQKEMSPSLLAMNPANAKYLDVTGLPEGFSSSYSYKIAQQMSDILRELHKRPGSRRAYLNILMAEDKVVLHSSTTHEYPCTIGMSLMIREDRLHAMVQMRSNNLFRVMPYDVFCFTGIMLSLCGSLGVEPGHYHHYICSAHVYKNDFPHLPYGLARATA